MRTELKVFAEEMENILQANDAKKGDSFKTMPEQELYNLLSAKILTYQHIRESGSDTRHELLDIANYCMMLYYREGTRRPEENDVAKLQKEGKWWLNELDKMHSSHDVNLDHKDCKEIADILKELMKMRGWIE